MKAIAPRVQYRIEARYTICNGEGRRINAGLPTFYLDADIQWIRDEEHAKAIAISIINPLGNENMAVHIAVFREEYQ